MFTEAKEYSDYFNNICITTYWNFYSTYNHSDVTKSVLASQITDIPFVQAPIKKIKAPRHWLLKGIHQWPLYSTQNGQ